MPFKTKKQKAAAASRRFTFSESGQVSYKMSSDKKSDEIVKLNDSGKPTSSLKAKVSHLSQIEDISYIRGDLLKIIILATFIIVGQFLLKSFFPQI